MSRVTNVIITTACVDDERLLTLNLAVNARLDGEMGPFFQDVPGAFTAGTKNLECNVYLGGFNHLEVKELKAAIESVPWECPRSVQLFVLREEGERFSEVGLWERGE